MRAPPEVAAAFLRVGRVAEWFKAAVLKTAVGASSPWVRIPPLPPLKIYKILNSFSFIKIHIRGPTCGPTRL